MVISLPGITPTCSSRSTCYLHAPAGDVDDLPGERQGLANGRDLDLALRPQHSAASAPVLVTISALSADRAEAEQRVEPQRSINCLVW